MIRSQKTRGGLPVLVALILMMQLAGTVVAQDKTNETPEEIKASIQEAMIELSDQAKLTGRAYGPFRRGVPQDQAEWAKIQILLDGVEKVADSASELHHKVDRLRSTEGFKPKVSRSELRERVALADSLTKLAHVTAKSDWRQGLPKSPEEARAKLAERALFAKQISDRTAAANTNLAYAVGVTEGVGPKSLSLSLVGFLVVFSVLALISGVVGLIRKMDDGWQVQEKEQAVEALTKDPTIDTTTAVLIAASVATVITGRHRVRKIRRLLSPRTKRTPWSAQGRLILQGSHAVSRKQN